jgi:uncharacterized iron-regulated membrane protein
MNLRRVLFKAHSVLGVYLALFLVVQLLSGIFLSFRWEITDSLYKVSESKQANFESLSAGEIVADYLQKNPQQQLNRLYFPRSINSAYLLQLKVDEEKRNVAIDPFTGEILRAGGWLKFPAEAAVKIHSQPLPGWMGYLVVIVNSLLLLTMTLTGLIYGWPRKKRWKQFFQIKSDKKFQLWGRQLHKQIGFILAPLIMMMAVTGLFLMIEMLPIGQSVAKQQKSIVPQYNVVSAKLIDNSIYMAQQQFPLAVLRDIKFKTNQQIIVQSLADKNDPWAINSVTFSLDPLAVSNVIMAKDKQAWWPSLLPWHSGSIAGLAGRLVIVGCALALLFIMILGITVWWKKRQSLVI